MSKASKVIARIFGWIFTACIFWISLISGLLNVVCFEPTDNDGFFTWGPLAQIIIIIGMVISSVVIPSVLGIFGYKLTGMSKGKYALIAVGAWVCGMIWPIYLLLQWYL